MIAAITGATGMIGSTIARQLLEQGHEVIAIVRPNSSRMDNVPRSPKLKLIECEISDYDSIMSKFKCDMFFHMAWNSTYGEKRDDTNIQLDNIRDTLTAVKLAKSCGSEVFVGAGSQAEYGPTDCVLSGSTPVDPESGYGIAKYTAYKMSRILCSQLNMRFCWGRIISAFGDLDAEHTFISYLIKSFLTKTSPNVTKCEQTWDYIYSEDVATAFIAIAKNGKDGKAYCIGSGKPRRMKEYVESIREEIDPSVKINYGAIPYYPHQPMYLHTDITELSKDTGFVPKYSFEDGIRRTIAAKKRADHQS